MQAVVDVVLPVFGLILVGYLAGRLKLLGQESSEALNRFVYFFALPALLFIGMARVSAQDVLNLPFLAAFLGGIVIVFAIALVVARFAFPGTGAGMMLGALSSVFANTGYMGIPLFLTAFGPQGALPAVIAAVAMAALVMAGGVIMIELALSAGSGIGKALVNVGRAVALNPLVIGSVLGFVWSAAGLPVPKPVATFADLLGAAAGPAALFAIGLFLASQSLNALMGGRRAIEVVWLLVLKLLVQPLATWWIAVAMDLDPFWSASAVILSGLPTGALIFVLAQQYGVYLQRASAVILASTVVSVVTLSAIMVLLNPVAP
ncbi:MAG TPA: AEC family transporter [Alphaproteobacteria bacterium]|nr:AEC family transporter [Alphaproteobacteria bacterium]